ncbi:Txe/YoeB family addiction module toxin [Sandaracinobacteroides saxicola]|uniref:Putative mRNA interferase YoeB n=1 Tax=Sandaracinobacteroides saxicola TaxID=2759707 RepID=A0A7G5IGR1_9SPHN|nr:Txe/YoeB family addiction module toxin [Sandaracinobacteroides saxicola]QMW22553.1 Txe/YoeB family addiction module toxin [Sandaracinobacteroides saxicola]
MIIVFFPTAWTAYCHWQATDRQTLERLNALIEECCRHPFTGTGKPEPLKNELKGFWSRRITREDRLVYRVAGQGKEQRLEIAQCRFHY